MSNFTFVKTTLPMLHDDCVRAESHVVSDPRSACFYARRAVEELVGYLYDILELPIPYRDDLAAKISAPPFRTVVPSAIADRLTLIRKAGNAAVHDRRTISGEEALGNLRDLFNVMVWASYNHSPRPKAAPVGSQFNPELAKRLAPLSPEELVQLAAQDQRQKDAHAQQLAEQQELLEASNAEIAELRQQIAAAQAANAPDTRDYNEAETRTRVIDGLLHEAGWLLDQPRDREFPVTGMPNGQGTGFVDYVLWGADGLPLAVVEAKRTTSSPEVGQHQAKLYADCLERQCGRRPVIFYTNGIEHRLWDDAGGYPPRDVQGFYTRDELELLIQRRQTRLQLSSQSVNSEIAGRPYQLRAIKAVGDTFDRKQREALLVMATGSGKTRTTIALIDLLQQANWAKRVLFLADRTALVRQTANAFREHLPASTTVNLADDRTGQGRIYVSTYQTMMNLIDQVDDSRRRFSPGHFDLIVIDEAHRSVYARYGAIFDYFDALLVGLTATPKDEVDHNTYRLFHLEDGVPTDNYSLDEAVADGYLVPPKGISVGTQFLRGGIRYVDLTDDEKDQWDALDWGEDGPPDEVGTEALNRFLFNEDTVDKVLETLMTRGYRVAGGDRLGKTIIFAKSQQHAEFIEQRFNVAYPEYAGQFARVITHDNRYAHTLIDEFSSRDRAPHIAISVDMLDTGIDVPEVVNLVFFKMVRAKSKFWQMIGRGTRLCPDLFAPGEDKRDFLVFDFCGNLEYFSQDLPGSQGQVQKSLAQRLFEARLSLVTTLGHSEPQLRNDAAAELHRVVAAMNLDNFVVRPHRRAVERFAAPAAWQQLSTEDATLLLSIAGLPSTVRDDDEAAKRFDLVMLRRQLAQLEGDLVLAERLRETVQNIAIALLDRTAIPSVAERVELLEAISTDQWWQDVTLPLLEQARRAVRGLVRFIERTARNPIYTDFEDTLSEASEVNLPGVTPGTNRERFQAKVSAYLREHLDNLALQRLRRARQLTPADLSELEQLLVAAGGGAADITWASETNGGLGMFIRRLVGLDRSAALDAFESYLDQSRFSADQIRFVNLIVDELTRNGAMEPARLFESPYTDQAPTGPDFLFPNGDVEVIVSRLHEITQTAMPSEVA